MLAGDGLPEGSTDLVTLCGCQSQALHFVSLDTGRLTYTLAGLEVNLWVKSWSALLFSRRNTARRGARVLFQGPVSGRWAVRTISRMLAVLTVVCWYGSVKEDAGVSGRRGGAGGGEVESVFVGGVCESEAARDARMFWGRQPTAAKRAAGAWVNKGRAHALARTRAGFHFAVAVGSIGKEREHLTVLPVSSPRAQSWPPSEHRWRLRHSLFTHGNSSASSLSLLVSAMHLLSLRQNLDF